MKGTIMFPILQGADSIQAEKNNANYLFLKKKKKKSKKILFCFTLKSQFLLFVLQLQNLLPLQQVPLTENIVEEYGLKDTDLPKQLFT